MKVFDNSKDIIIGDEIQKEYQYREEGDYYKSFKHDEKLGILGGHEGLAYFAESFYEGYGVKKNYKLAFLLFSYMVKNIDKKTQANDFVALSFLGDFYCYGKYVKKDYKRAIDYYKKAIEKGDVAALSALGVMYAKGEGVKKDCKKALELFEEAAKNGNSAGYINIGVYYEKEAPKNEIDKKKALMYYQKAKLMDSKVGEKYYNELYEKIKGLKKNERYE